MPLQATSGAASQDAYGGNGVAVVPAYIEDVFSTYLLVGNATTTTINNGIDLSGKGGLVWLKDRTGAGYHNLGDTARSGNVLYSNTTDAQSTVYPFAFTSTGFTLDGNLLDSGRNFVTWTLRKQPKFFDIQTWTGSGANRTISHSLGSVPACIIVKRTDTTGAWQVYHRSLANTEYLVLNSTAVTATGATRWNSTTPTSTVFSLGTDASVNASAGTYVAYIFAHDAGGFGLTGTDNVISCGSYTGTGATGNTVTLGYEPQWLMIKGITAANDWIIYDNMRGMPASATNTGNTKFLKPNLSNAEAGGNTIAPTATGFEINTGAAVVNTTSDTYIYIAIRRGPMKVPTSGTSVYKGISRSGTGATATISGVGFAPDLAIGKDSGVGGASVVSDKLRGAQYELLAQATDAETFYSNDYLSFTNDGAEIGSGFAGWLNGSGRTNINWFFRRAPSFFDEVCWTTGSSTNRQITHNLTVAPELIFVKSRNNAQNWAGYAAPLGINKGIVLNSTGAAFSATGLWGTSAPTSTNFSMDETYYFPSGYTVVTYLFATCAGVSKVGSYTGTGATQTINCGFGASGSRFVLIKRTDSTGDWYVWDSARGMVSGTDPSLLLNSTAAEVNANSVYAISTGFQIVSTAAGINASAGTYIFLSVA